MKNGSCPLAATLAGRLVWAGAVATIKYLSVANIKYLAVANIKYLAVANIKYLAVANIKYMAVVNIKYFFVDLGNCDATFLCNILNQAIGGKSVFAAMTTRRLCSYHVDTRMQLVE